MYHNIDCDVCWRMFVCVSVCVCDCVCVKGVMGDDVVGWWCYTGFASANKCPAGPPPPR